MSDDETFYEVLSIPRDASPETVERAYRRRVKECHPDVSDDPNARERFERVTRARAVLSDRAERRRYDRLGHEAYRARRNGDRTDRPASTATAASRDRNVASTTTDARAGNGSTGSTAETEAEAEPGHDASRGRSREPGGSAAEPESDHATEVGPPGRFLLREVAATAAVGLGAAASGALALALHPPLVSVGVFLVSWAVVAAVAGRLAAGGGGTLPDDVVRAHAFPLLVLVAAWYVALGTDYRLLAGGLTAYAAFAALFRTAALASDAGTSPGRAAGVWFLATAPGALLVYVSSTGSPDTLYPAVSNALLSVPLAGGRGSMVVAAIAAVPVAVFVLGHALWRLGDVVA